MYICSMFGMVKINFGHENSTITSSMFKKNVFFFVDVVVSDDVRKVTVNDLINFSVNELKSFIRFY